ncbi:MAG: response regulator [Acidimicrobiales bacterium]
MAEVLVVADSPSVLADVRAALEDSGTEITEVGAGELVRDAVAALKPDLVVTDLQVSAMGGIAICLDLHLEASAGRIPEVPVLILLDRRADVFLARRAAAEGFVLKPLDPRRLRRAARALLGGGTYHDESYEPLPLPTRT